MIQINSYLDVQARRKEQEELRAHREKQEANGNADEANEVRIVNKARESLDFMQGARL